MFEYAESLKHNTNVITCQVSDVWKNQHGNEKPQLGYEKQR